MSLTDKIFHKIQTHGPLTLEEYMTLCLYDPQEGYYVTRNPLGCQGDFITAPEISQLFGEMIGLWCLKMWFQLGRPSFLHLIELGPGQGTLMIDILRVARCFPAFFQALHVSLIEISSPLRQLQKRKLSSQKAPIRWLTQWPDVFNNPLIVIANEFFDAFPIRQKIFHHHQWWERWVHLQNNHLHFCDLPSSPEPISPSQEPYYYEYSPEAERWYKKIFKAIALHKGAALWIDYGYHHPQGENTFQAVKDHRYAHPLTHCGNVDLTAHVNFHQIERYALRYALTTKLMSQKEFLYAEGIQVRLSKLQEKAKEDIKQTLFQGYSRLVEDMGALFKVFQGYRCL